MELRNKCNTDCLASNIHRWLYWCVNIEIQPICDRHFHELLTQYIIINIEIRSVVPLLLCTHRELSAYICKLSTRVGTASMSPLQLHSKCINGRWQQTIIMCLPLGIRQFWVTQTLWLRRLYANPNEQNQMEIKIC